MSIKQIELFHEIDNDLQQGEFIFRFETIVCVYDIHFEFEIYNSFSIQSKLYAEIYPSNKKKKYVGLLNEDIKDLILRGKINEAFIYWLISSSNVPDDKNTRRHIESSGLLYYLGLSNDEYDMLINKDNYTIEEE